MTGVMGKKALLIVDGGAPKALSPNQSHQGVHLIAVQGDQAIVEVQGLRQTLRIGDAPSSVGNSFLQQRVVVLRADSRGHFRGKGFINNKPIRYMVDTGASAIGIGQPDAEKLNIDFTSGTPVMLNTANGAVQGWRIKLESFRIEGITLHQVDAVVSPQPMDYVLLGNSFLASLSLKRQGNEMVLEKR